MNIAIYDPMPMGNEYFTKMFAASMRKFATNNGVRCSECTNLKEPRDSHVVVLTDHLSEDLIQDLKQRGNRVIGFNVTDSSYISGAIRYAKNLPQVDLIFMVSGVPHTNQGSEIAVDANFNVTLVDKPFLDEENWKIFDAMRQAGKLQSLPYVPWTAPPDVPRTAWAQRSQKVILRGGGHARRILLALFLLRLEKLDPNSGFVLHPYFADDMNPAFKYCTECRMTFKSHGNRYPFIPNLGHLVCPGPHATPDGHWSLQDLGQWNNRCPRSFYWMAEQFMKNHGWVDMKLIEDMLNARWLHPKEHMERLARITFTADLKWVHSIYAPQRFWEAACAGCINVMPLRAMNQEYFPKITAGQHYMVFEETFEHLDLAFLADESGYNNIAGEARRLYETWLSPTVYPINTNLLSHIFEEMRKV